MADRLRLEASVLRAINATRGCRLRCVDKLRPDCVQEPVVKPQLACTKSLLQLCAAGHGMQDMLLATDLQLAVHMSLLGCMMPGVIHYSKG